MHLAILTALLGCGGLGLEITGDLEEALLVEEISPDWGPPGGGNEVTISGRGFVDPVTVRFGNKVLDLTLLDEETIVVTAPNAGMEAAVDVTVESALGRVVVERGYTFSDSAPDPDVSDVTGLVELSHLQVACPQCFSAVQGVFVDAYAAFHEPVSTHWTEWLPPPRLLRHHQRRLPAHHLVHRRGG